jgi:predicted DNA-binding transcriptional regulator YafY
MPFAKNAYLRYRIINSCFANRQKRYWTIAELIEKLADHDIDVERRTIENDFEVMRHDERLGYAAPIVYDRREKAFHYSDPNFTIDQMPLTEEDLQALTLATNILHQYKGVRMVQQFNGVVDKIGKVVNHLRQPDKRKIMAFEKSPYYKGQEFVDELLSAILARQPLVITYRKFSGKENDEHEFHPYFLKEFRGRWYSVGFSEARGHVITLALDRMVKVGKSECVFRGNDMVKPKEYFQHTLGVTLGKGPVEEIQLWFSPAQAPYIKTQYVHHTQKIEIDNEDGLVVTIRLIPNPELTQLILGYGAEVRVLKPLSLRDAIYKVWEKALNG